MTSRVIGIWELHVNDVVSNVREVHVHDVVSEWHWIGA